MTNNIDGGGTTAVVRGPDGTLESGAGGDGTAAYLFRVLEQASDPSSIRIDALHSAAAVGTKVGSVGGGRPGSLAGAGLPVGINDPALRARNATTSAIGLVAAAASAKRKGGPSAAKGGTGAALLQGAKQKRRGWKKPEGRPSRPLSAYNLFFQAEREAMVSKMKKENGIKVEEGKEGSKNDAGNEKSGEDGSSPTKRRKRGPPTGIPFATMAQRIAAKWKTLDDDAKSSFVSKAAVDRGRYEREMVVWKSSDDFRKYEEERKRNAKNRATKSTKLKAGGPSSALGGGIAGIDKLMPVPLPESLPQAKLTSPAGVVEEDGPTLLQRLFEAGEESQGGVVSPEALATMATRGQRSGGTDQSPWLAQQHLDEKSQPLQLPHAQQQGQGKMTDSQVSSLLNGLQPSPMRDSDTAPLQQHQDAQDSILPTRLETSHLHQVDASAKQKALLAQQQMQLQLIKQQEVKAQGGLGGLPSSMMQSSPSQQGDPFLQLLQQHGMASISGAKDQGEGALLHTRRDAEAIKTGQSDSLDLGGLLANGVQSSSLALGGTAAVKKDSLGLGSTFTGAGERDSLGLGGVFPTTSGAGQSGSTGLGDVAPLPNADSSGFLSAQQLPPLGGGMPQAPQLQQKPPSTQGDGRLTLQQMLRRQRQQNQESSMMQGASLPSAGPLGLGGAGENMHSLQQQHQQLLQLQQQHQQQLLLLRQQEQQLGGLNQALGGGAPEMGRHPLFAASAAPQGMPQGMAQQQRHQGHQDDDLAMFANIFQEQQQHQQQGASV